MNSVIREPAVSVRRGLWVVTAVLLVLGISGCTSSPDDKDSSSSAAGTPTDSATLFPEDLPEVPTLDQSQGVAGSVKMRRCPTATGEQRALGKITNSLAKKSDVVIVVNWTDPEAQLVARGVAVVRQLGPGHREAWVAKATVPEEATTCTASAWTGRLQGDDG